MSRPPAWTPETKPLWLIDDSADEIHRLRRNENYDEPRQRPKPKRRQRHRPGDYDDGSADVPLFTEAECTAATGVAG